MDNKVNFEGFKNDLDKLQFPYKHMVKDSEEIKISLFKEYISTDLDPDLSLFTKKYFTDEEVDAGFKYANRKIPLVKSKKNVIAGSFTQTDFEIRLHEIAKEFYSLKNKNQLDKKYCKFNLAKTNTVKTLYDIERQIRNIKKSSESRVPQFAEKIIFLISKLQPEELRIAITENFSDSNQVFWLSELEDEEERIKADFLRTFFKPKINEVKAPKEENKLSIKNPYPQIFTSQEAYNLFIKLHGAYKGKDFPQANYSFIYLTMDADGYILQSAVGFKNWLSKEFDITLDRIDSRKYKDSKRMTTYSLIKDSLGMFEDI
ncbi:hypothetical protein [Christiangramia sp.]|uniref:hypothetical protein n=1 Tax=Christiangramia sp. TaxID=1931228 RepID=UPI00260A24D0|nr:hypothetical protein [Christiangramia sp.]